MLLEHQAALIDQDEQMESVQQVLWLVQDWQRLNQIARKPAGVDVDLMMDQWGAVFPELEDVDRLLEISHRGAVVEH